VVVYLASGYRQMHTMFGKGLSVSRTQNSQVANFAIIMQTVYPDVLLRLRR